MVLNPIWSVLRLQDEQSKIFLIRLPTAAQHLIAFFSKKLGKLKSLAPTP